MKKHETIKTKKQLNFIERLFIKLFINSLIKKIDNMKGSWRTTILGIATLLGALALVAKALLDGDPATNPDFNELLAALAGLGLWAARDNKVTSEDVGAK